MIGELVLLDEVGPAYLNRIQAQLVSYQIHRSFSDIGGLRPSCSTICVSRSLVGEDSITADMHGDIISPAGYDKTEGHHDNVGEDLAIGAQVGDGMNLEASHTPLFGCRNLDIVNLVSAMDRCSKALAAAFNPLHRAA